MSKLQRKYFGRKKRNAYTLSRSKSKRYSKRYSKRPSKKYSSKHSSMEKIYERMPYSEMTGSIQAGTYGIKKSDVFEHTFPVPPAVYGVARSGSYWLKKGTLVLKPRTSRPLYKRYGRTSGGAQ